ncbi:site-specific DNA-methyltransferase [Mastigocladus laminosus UU774]|nr:restriction endonuclease subunit M [Westiellopsis prolifica IICB1]TFI53784.1 site-specific DNA-methyltransferase [Mastigocladus laminosus UU774]
MIPEENCNLKKYDSQNPQVFYDHSNGKLWIGDAIKWLQSLASESVDLVFADPPYNIKKASWDNFKSQAAYINWSLIWIEEVSRILKPTGSLYICGFSEIIADIKLPALKFFSSCRWLIWHYKNKANFSNDWGRSHESILHFRKTKNFKLNPENIRISYGQHTLKYPQHPQAKTSQYDNNDKNDSRIWHPHSKGAKPRDVIEIPTTCNGMHEKTKHPTQKPEELVRKFVLSSSSRGDLVVDPFFGSGTTLVVAEQLGRKWLGCEIIPEYAEWAVERIKSVKNMSDEEWFWFDRKNEERRKKIR